MASGSAKSEAKSGRRAKAWEKLGWRELRDEAETATSCVAGSCGQVCDFFAEHPCKSVQRLTVAVADGEGGTVAVSITWVAEAAVAAGHPDPATERLAKDVAMLMPKP